MILSTRIATTVARTCPARGFIISMLNRRPHMMQELPLRVINDLRAGSGTGVVVGNDGEPLSTTECCICTHKSIPLELRTMIAKVAAISGDSICITYQGGSRYTVPMEDVHPVAMQELPAGEQGMYLTTQDGFILGEIDFTQKVLSSASAPKIVFGRTNTYHIRYTAQFISSIYSALVKSKNSARDITSALCSVPTCVHSYVGATLPEHRAINMQLKTITATQHIQLQALRAKLDMQDRLHTADISASMIAIRIYQMFLQQHLARTRAPIICNKSDLRGSGMCAYSIDSGNISSESAWWALVRRGADVPCVLIPIRMQPTSVYNAGGRYSLPKHMRGAVTIRGAYLLLMIRTVRNTYECTIEGVYTRGRKHTYIPGIHYHQNRNAACFGSVDKLIRIPIDGILEGKWERISQGILNRVRRAETSLRTIDLGSLLVSNPPGRPTANALHKICTPKNKLTTRTRRV